MLIFVEKRDNKKKRRFFVGKGQAMLNWEPRENEVRTSCHIFLYKIRRYVRTHTSIYFIPWRILRYVRGIWNPARMQSTAVMNGWTAPTSSTRTHRVSNSTEFTHTWWESAWAWNTCVWASLHPAIRNVSYRVVSTCIKKRKTWYRSLHSRDDNFSFFSSPLS